MPDFFQNLLSTAARTAPLPVTSGPVSRTASPASQTTVAPQPFDAVLTQAVAEQAAPAAVAPDAVVAPVAGEPLLPGEAAAVELPLDDPTADDVLLGNGLLAAAGLVVPPVIGLPSPVGNTLSLTEAAAVPVPTTADATPIPAAPVELPPTLASPTADRSRSDQLRLDVPPRPTPTPNQQQPVPADEPPADVAPADVPGQPVGARTTVGVTPATVTLAATNPRLAGPPAGRPAVVPAVTPVVADLNQNAVPVFAPPPVGDPVPATVAAAAVAGAATTATGGQPALSQDVLAAEAESAAATVQRPAGPAFAAELRQAEPTAAPVVEQAELPDAVPVVRGAVPAPADTAPIRSPVERVPAAAPTVVTASSEAVPARPPVASVPAAPTGETPQPDVRPSTARPAVVAATYARVAEVTAPPTPSAVPVVAPAANTTVATGAGAKPQAAQAVGPVVAQPVEPLARPVEVAETKERPESPDVVAVAPPPAPALPQNTTPVAAPRAVHVQVAEQITTHATVAVRDGATEFRMRLDPPDLGRVDVRLTASPDGLRAEVLVGDDGVRRMIEGQLPDLRQRLEQAGVSVQRFDVSTGGGSNNSFAQNSNGRAWDDRAADLPPVSAPPAPRRQRPAVAGSALDVTV